MDTKYQCKAEMEQNDKLGVKIGGMGSAAGKVSVKTRTRVSQVTGRTLQALSRSNKRIAKWLLDNPGFALELSLMSSGCYWKFRSTVVRFCKALGVEGFAVETPISAASCPGHLVTCQR